jgi:iron complex outermembrane receptor protein
MLTKTRGLPASLLTSLVLLPFGLFAQDEDLVALQAFISEETASEDSNSLLPTDRTVDSAFFSDMSILETPRSVLTLSPEAMKQFQIKDFDDLSKVGAGTERYNFYGIAGAPVIRGWQGGTYFNGMMRAFQRNEMPTSFGSLEALNIVKGAAPAQLVPSHVGGYANMIPKSPYFDKFRGSVKLEIGSHSFYNLQVDVGEPFLLGDIPAAYRISLTGQNAESYYDSVDNDYYSVYGSIKLKPSDSIRIFTGGEFFQFKSNENAGWNRPTQNLIDNGEYVIGEPLSVVRAANGGVADRNIIDGLVWDYGPVDPANRPLFRALVVPSDVVDAGVADGLITAAQRDLMVNMGDAAARAAVYAGMPADVEQTMSGYVYTPEYFNAGGSVFTEKVDGNEVLADDSDFADSFDFIYFFDVVGEPSDTFSWKNQFFFEYLETRKLSSYGYAFDSDQLVLDNRFSFTNEFGGDFVTTKLSYGFEVRYTEALQLQDFWVEPFARRDITRDEVSANSVILSGGQRDPLIGGNNYWGGGFGSSGPAGHAAKSEMLQGGIFTVANVGFGDRFNVIIGVRGEKAGFDAHVPEAASDIAPNETSDTIKYWNGSVNPVFKLTDKVSLYGVLQEATTISPTQGGAILGAGNFGSSKLQEIGLKFDLFDRKLFATVAWYGWEQSSFNDRAASASQFESEGLEVELVLQATDNLTFMASYTDRSTQKRGGLEFRTMPWGLVDPTGQGNDEIGVALESGALLNQFAAAFGGFTPEGSSPSENPDLNVPGAPERTVKFFATYRFDNGFGISGNMRYQDGYYHNYDHTLYIPQATVFDLNLSYKAERYEVIFGIQNLTNEDYFVGAEPEFGANTLITKAEETRYDLSLTYFF